MLGIHQGTYDAIFQHPIARNLQWRDVHAMLIALSDSSQENADNVKFTRNGQTLVVHPPRRKDFSDIAELMQIRRFLDKTGAATKAAGAQGQASSPAAEGAHLLVVIDHREARIFKTELHGAAPQRITPVDPNGAHRHLRHVEEDATGQRKPELKSFYEAIARSLAGAGQILIFGSATGSSSAMEHLQAELKEHHPDLARKVVGAVTVNEQHMSEDQLLAEARAFYAAGGKQAEVHAQ